MHHASAPAKVILSGEHSVVYGCPCLVAAIELRSEASVEVIPEGAIEIMSDRLGRQSFSPTAIGNGGMGPLAAVAATALKRANHGGGLRIRVSSQIPMGSGLGSSASVLVAVASACASALGLGIDMEGIAALASEGEEKIHFKPSGVDVNIALRGGTMLYRRGRPPERVQYPEGIKLIIGDSGLSRRTGDMVKRVADLADSQRDRFDICLRSLGDITGGMARALAENDMAGVGRMMLLNHAILCLLGVSSEGLDRLVRSALHSSAWGAKLTGAGGGGCIVAISPPGQEGEVARGIEQVGGKPFIVGISREGVRNWINRQP